MSRIFLLFWMSIAAFGLPACNRSTDARPPLPEEIAAVVKPFYAAVRRGDQKAAEKYVAPGFIDDSRVQFAEMSRILKDAPRLAPAIQQRQGSGAYLTFAGQHGKMWIISEVRVVRYRNKPMIEYWDVTTTDKAPELVTHTQDMKRYTIYALMTVAFAALAGLASLIWVVRNRTHIIAPGSAIETRRVAATVRNTEP
jgi:hypothetical protein